MSVTPVALARGAFWGAVWGALGSASLAHAGALFVHAPAALPGPQPCAVDDEDPETPSGEGCNTHQAQLADLDGDGDLDIVFANSGGEFTPGDAQPLVIYLNNSTTGTPAFSYATDDLLGGYTGRSQQVAIGDIDGDGDLDLVAPDGYGLQADAVWVNAQNVWENQGAQRLGTTSRAGAVRLGDVDDDGDLDLFIADWGDAPPTSLGVGRLYANDGGGAFVEIPDAIPSDLSDVGTGPVDADFADIDTDNDLDLVIASADGDSLLLVNDGRGAFSEANTQLPTQNGPFAHGADACDVDGDDDLDLWLGDAERDGLEQLMINNGNGSYSNQTELRVAGNTAAEDPAVICADTDQDGDMDAVIASLDGAERVLENDGTGLYSLSAGTFTGSDGGPVNDETHGLALGDIDGDGILDAVTGQGSGDDLTDKVYAGVGSIDDIAPTIRHFDRFVSQVDEQQAAFHFSVQDGSTSELGPRLQWAYANFDGVAVDAAWVGGDLFRASLDLTEGPHTLKACAVDAAGNETCTSEANFSIGDVQDCGCASAPDPTDLALCLSVLGAAFGVSRRRARMGPRSR
ncbi:MAG: VCBS repeat-containing protein [Myxococcales bacterium]|nr:VCBS repeat-containing protein [Myxococcales bacterium]